MNEKKWNCAFLCAIGGGGGGPAATTAGGPRVSIAGAAANGTYENMDAWYELMHVCESPSVGVGVCVWQSACKLSINYWNHSWKPFPDKPLWWFRGVFDFFFQYFKTTVLLKLTEFGKLNSKWSWYFLTLTTQARIGWLRLAHTLSVRRRDIPLGPPSLFIKPVNGWGR